MPRIVPLALLLLVACSAEVAGTRPVPCCPDDEGGAGGEAGSGGGTADGGAAGGGGTQGDPCSPDPCGDHGTCRVEDGAASCDCADGHAFDGTTCTKVDPCRDHRCPHRSSCSPVAGEPTCVCEPGYELAGAACADVDECLQADACAADAVCTNTDGSHTCTCRPGFRGDGSSCAPHVAPIRQIAAGPDHTCALDEEGAVYCWGAFDETLAPVPAPRLVHVPVRASAIGAGGVRRSLADDWLEARTCAAGVDGSMWCWGAPDEVQPLRGFASSAWRSILVGRNATCAVDDAGAMACGAEILAVRVLSAVAGTSSDLGESVCAMGEAGRAFCLGDPGFVVIPDGPWRRVVPSWHGSIRLHESGTLERHHSHGGPGELAVGLSWTDLEAGRVDLSIATPTPNLCGLLPEGSLECLGDNGEGSLGTGEADRRTGPARVTPEGGWVSVAVGVSHACGLREDGTVQCWGANDLGQLGRGEAWAPRQLHRHEGAFVHVDQEWSHACALAADGAAYCWGAGTLGQLGDGAGASRSRPVRVGAERFRAVTAGGWHSCGVREDGTLLCWGVPRGLGEKEPWLSPRPVDDRRDWVAVDAGLSFACGLRADASLWCWGSNGVGQLGVGHEDPVEGLVEVGAGRRWSDLRVFDGMGCARPEDGRLHCWGGDRGGKVFGGVPHEVPTPVPAWKEPVPSGVCRVDAGELVCAVPALVNGYHWFHTPRAGVLGDGRGFDPVPREVAWPQ